MGSSIKWLLALGAGVAAGWALRSLSDTPEGAGVRLLEIGIKAKERMSSWAAIERERLDDMLAEAQSNIAHETAAAGAPARERQSARRGTARKPRGESMQSKTPKSSAASLNS
jgi:hypothetical protein